MWVRFRKAVHFGVSHEDISVELSIDQKRVVDDWVRQKVEHHICQLCQSSRWGIGELIACTERDAAFHANTGMVQLICENCGHTLLFDVSRIKQWHTVDTASELM
jgi:hypothetical protein